MAGNPDVRRTPAAPGGKVNQASEQLAKRLRALAADAPAPEEALEPALRSLLEAGGASAGAVCLFDQRNEMLRLAAEVGLSDDGCRQLRSVRRGGMGTWDMPLHSLLNRRAYLIESAARNRYVPPLVEPASSVRTLACVPLYAGATPLASLILVAVTPQSFTERDIRNLDPALRELVKIIEAVRNRAIQTGAQPPPEEKPPVAAPVRPEATAALPPELAPGRAPAAAPEPAPAPAPVVPDAERSRLAAELANVCLQLEAAQLHSTTLQRERDGLVAERDQLRAAAGTGTDADVLRASLATAEATLAAVRTELDAVRNAAAAAQAAQQATEADGTAALARERATHEEALATLRAEHESALAAVRAAHDAALAALQSEHETGLASVRSEQDVALATLRAEQATALAALGAEQEATVTRLRAEHDELVAGLRSEHDAALASVRTEHEAALAARTQEHEAAVATLERAHADALAAHAAGVAEAETARDEARAAQAAAEADRDAAREQSAASQQERDALGAQLAQVVAEHERVAAQADAQRTQTDDDARAAATGLAADRDAARDEVERVRAELAQVREALQVVDAERRHLQIALDAAASETVPPFVTPGDDESPLALDVPVASDVEVGTASSHDDASVLDPEPFATLDGPAMDEVAAVPEAAAEVADVAVVDVAAVEVAVAATAVDPSAPCVLILDHEIGWDPGAFDGHAVHLAAPRGEHGALTPTRIVANLASTGTLEALAAMRGAGNRSRMWGYLGASADRILPLALIEPLVRPLDPETVIAAVTAHAAPGTRVVTVGADVDALISLRQALARQGLSVSMAWNAKQAEDLLAMVKPQLAVIDLELPQRDAYGIISRLASTKPVPTMLLVTSSDDPAERFAALAADPTHGERLVPRPRLFAALDNLREPAMPQRSARKAATGRR